MLIHTSHRTKVEPCSTNASRKSIKTARLCARCMYSSSGTCRADEQAAVVARCLSGLVMVIWVAVQSLVVSGTAISPHPALTPQHTTSPHCTSWHPDVSVVHPPPSPNLPKPTRPPAHGADIWYRCVLHVCPGGEGGESSASPEHNSCVACHANALTPASTPRKSCVTLRASMQCGPLVVLACND
jgi:hypothetical protein